MTPTTLEGQTLGKYRVLEPLGRGGMAQVYRAYHPQLDRYVAVKVLRSDLIDEEEFLARFQREARAVAALRHPNIVQVYDFDVQDDLYYMVMELLEGDTLKAYMNHFRSQGKRVPHADMVRILVDALSGLGYAHTEGITHRDIKPANIMLTRRGQAVVTDFGIAQIVGGTQYTVSGALMGTLNYMAPEQGLQGRGDSRSDLYSLGIVFYEMLTGRPPFEADTPLAILLKHLNDPLPLPHKLVPTVPEPFERVVLKALAKSPEDRYQTAQEMSVALCASAAEAEIGIADKIALPISFAAKSDSSTARVFSGEDRQKLAGQAIAADDTDSDLQARLKASAAAGPAPEAVDAPSEPGIALIPGAAPAGMSFRESLRSLLDKALAVSDRAFPPSLRADTRQVDVTTLVGSAFFLVLVNLAAAWLSGALGNFGVFTYGWPMELVLISTILALVLSLVRSPWVLIPIGIVMGNGLLLSFFSLTGYWHGWLYLWPLELLIVFGSLAAAFWLRNMPAADRLHLRRGGRLLALISAASAFVVLGLAALRVLFTPVPPAS